MVLGDARAQRDNNDGAAAEHLEEEEEEEEEDMPERPQHPESRGVVNEMEAGEDPGGLLERQRSERVGVLTELVVATAGEVLRVRRDATPGLGGTVSLGETSVYSIGRCMMTP